jgi:hypothetical protein
MGPIWRFLEQRLPAAIATGKSSARRHGALHGEAALPKRWRDNLLGRTTEADDGYVLDLLDALTRSAREAFGGAGGGYCRVIRPS